MPDHEFTTGRTEVGELAVGALQADRVLHDAIRIGTMSQTECMAQFVNGLFFQAAYKRRAADFRTAVGVAAQTITMEPLPLNWASPNTKEKMGLKRSTWVTPKTLSASGAAVSINFRRIKLELYCWRAASRA